MTFEGGPIFSAKNLNLNTIIIVGSLLAGFIVTWTNMQLRQQEFIKWQDDHIAHGEKVLGEINNHFTSQDVRIDQFKDQLSQIETRADNTVYRMTTAEKALENNDARTSRIADGFTNQFTEMRAQLGVLNTQMALALDSLKRVERFQTHPTEETLK